MALRLPVLITSGCGHLVISRHTLYPAVDEGLRKGAEDSRGKKWEPSFVLRPGNLGIHTSRACMHPSAPLAQTPVWDSPRNMQGEGPYDGLNTFRTMLGGLWLPPSFTLCSFSLACKFLPTLGVTSQFLLYLND